MTVAPRPYTRGWRAPWKGEWGTLRDGHSKLGRLAGRIEREILDTLPADLSPLLRRRIKSVAGLGALAEQARLTFGVDPKMTRRNVVVLAKSFERELTHLRSCVPGLAATPDESFALKVRGNGHGAN